MNFVDTHCHVHFNAYKDDMDDVIKRTREAGVFMITVGTQKDTSRNGLLMAEKYDGLWASVGLHPNHLCEQEFFDDDELPAEKQATPKIKTRCERFDHAAFLELTKHPKCVAIGECGLDYYRIPETADPKEVKQIQEETVRQHFDLATETDLPVIIHCRDAHADQQAIIKEYIATQKLARRGVVHCFTGTIEEANAYRELGFLVSFTGIITFPPRKGDPSTSSGQEGLSSLQKVVRDFPLESMMIETDSPYLTPLPHRGKRNEPGYVHFVAKKVAELKKLPLEEVARVTTANAVRLFGLKLP